MLFDFPPRHDCQQLFHRPTTFKISFFRPGNILLHALVVTAHQDHTHGSQTIPYPRVKYPAHVSAGVPAFFDGIV